MWSRSAPWQAAHEARMAHQPQPQLQPQFQRQLQPHCPTHALRRVFQEAATAAVATAPVSVGVAEHSMVPEPGTRAFRDWAQAFVEARGGSTGTGTSADASDVLIEALRVIANATRGSVLSCHDMPTAVGWKQQQHRQRQAQVALVQDAFAARARAALRRMQNIWQHLHPTVQHLQHTQLVQCVQRDQQRNTALSSHLKQECNRTTW